MEQSSGVCDSLSSMNYSSILKIVESSGQKNMESFVIKLVFVTGYVFTTCLEWSIFDFFPLVWLMSNFFQGCMDTKMQMCKVFSSTSQRFSVELRSGLCGGQNMFESESHAAWITPSVWAWWILILSSWNKHMPSEKKTDRKSIHRKTWPFSVFR